MIEIVTEISARLRRLACPSAGRSITDKTPDFSVTDKKFAGLGEIVRLQRETTDQLRPPLVAGGILIFPGFGIRGGGIFKELD